MYGAILGDIAGSEYEFDPVTAKDFPFHGFITDDSILTVAIQYAFIEYGLNPTTEQFSKALDKFALKFKFYKGAGWGANFYGWIADPHPYGSKGNGIASHVSPAGWIASSEQEALQLAVRIANATHNTDEGRRAAKAIALAIYMARNGKTKEEIGKRMKEFYPTMEPYSSYLGHYRYSELAEESVPQSIATFLDSNSLSDTIKKAILLKGDADTMAAISGSIAEALYGSSAVEGEAVFEAFGLSLDSNKVNLLRSTLKSFKELLLAIGHFKLSESSIGDYWFSREDSPDFK